MTSDPRNESGFQPDLWPRCEGEEIAEAPQTDRERRKFALLVAYYELNVAYNALSRFREGAPETRHGDTERELLQGVETALVARERLEDKLFTSGICATATLESGVVANLEFCEPNHRNVAPAGAGHSSSSLYVKLGNPFATQTES